MINKIKYRLSRAGGGECVQDTSQPLEMPIEHNGPGATQCHISGFGCVTLHNVIRKRYWADHQGLADEDDNNHRPVPGAWRNDQVLPDLWEP